MAADYIEENTRTIDRWCREGWEWGQALSHEDFLRAASGVIEVLLTPVKLVPLNWLGELKNKRVLALASGGGQQGPVFAAQGALVTVLDYSREQLLREQEVSRREGYEIELVRADMSQPLPFDDNSFDLIFHPVSNVYVESVEPIWKECFRVLKAGGRLLAGCDNGMNFIVDRDERIVQNALPFNPLTHEAYKKELAETDSGIQFSHTLDEQIGGQLRAGFILRDIYEDVNGGGRLHDLNIPTFFATWADKPG